MTGSSGDAGALTAKIVERIPVDVPEGRRFVVAIGGPPAAGKSTLAAALVEALAPRAAILGMDAFHFDDSVLIARGDRPRKGAPHTFDVGSYRHLLAVMRDSRDELAVPVFDRQLELSRNCASVVTTEHDVIITEGNYLLVDAEPWSQLSGLFDLTVAVATSPDVIESRIIERWRSFGFSAADARQKAETNDLPNARWVLEHSGPADLSLTSG